jgi:hypothetical protein
MDDADEVAAERLELTRHVGAVQEQPRAPPVVSARNLDPDQRITAAHLRGVAGEDLDRPAALEGERQPPPFVAGVAGAGDQGK